METPLSRERRTIRCAIYTRKSSEEGLDQEFNSLDAQFEACAAYIASQKAEGWKMVPERYDDGGISGGTLERPGIQRLMADVDAGRVDMIVVYKIDRLTRSLADFSRLIDRLDTANCSFVSVTQAFNTSTSMGRLTLNVLLSFAQFEREVTSERIRDKIAASKKKGLWMGGMVPMGYDVDPDPKVRGLLINPAEAGHISTLFALYDKHECLSAVAAKARDQGIRSKHRVFASGREFGGAVLSHGAVHNILTNPIYVGRIRHKHLVHDGQHEAIISDELWSRVQDKLQAHAARPRVRDPITRKLKQPDAKSLLAGKLFDETGDRLTPSHSRRATQTGHKRIRYYVSRRLMQGSKDDPSGWRLPALKMERAVCGAIADHLAEAGDTLFHDADPIALYRAQDGMRSIHDRLRARDGEVVRALVERVLIAPRHLTIQLSGTGMARALGIAPDSIDPDKLRIETGFELRRRGVEIKIITGQFERAPDQTLINAIAKARQWMSETRRGISLAAIGRRYGWTDSPVRQRIRLAFLSPEITTAILDGRQPPELTLQYLLTHPIALDWHEQARTLGFIDGKILCSAK
ncbi:recombinase family protein [uncultured Maricaulis sp.]|uniref:recombinase family protein n=1 Tax=uncultured Maricaulis sp. TaxID=174710 RepID=UPI002611B83D|nr:recombinase family protein [uncultured Maricaulis sp.]